MTRYKVDAQREVYSLKQRLASQLKTQAGTANATTAKICDAVIPSLRSQIELLEVEITTLADRPERTFAHTDGNFPCLTRTTSLSEDELAELEIPAFLKRSTPTEKAL